MAWEQASLIHWVPDSPPFLSVHFSITAPQDSQSFEVWEEEDGEAVRPELLASEVADSNAKSLHVKKARIDYLKLR